MGAPVKALSLDLAPLLAALLKERSVTRAAARMGMSQSAMSHVLAKLRVALRDPILVRTSRGAALTPRAEALAAPLERALTELERLLGGVETAPARLERRFVIAAPDYVAWLLVPGLVEAAAREAPLVDLEVRTLEPWTLEHQLELGDVDVAVGGLSDASPSLMRRSLFRDSFACVVRRKHPATRAPFTLERYLALGHALVGLRPSAQGVVDHALAALGRERRVMVRVPYFLLAPHIIATSDLVLTVPGRLAHDVSKAYPLAILDAPLELPMTEVVMTWHERFAADPGHAWFRELVARVAAAT